MSFQLMCNSSFIGSVGSRRYIGLLVIIMKNFALIVVDHDLLLMNKKILVGAIQFVNAVGCIM